MSAVGLPDANYDKVSDGKGCGEKETFFSPATKQKIAMFPLKKCK